MATVVEVSAQHLNFPAKCCCCGSLPNSTFTISAAKQTGKRVVHTRTQAWNLPICHHCLNHTVLWRAAERNFTLLIALAITLGVVFGLWIALWFGLVLLAPLLVLAFMVRKNGRLAAMANMSTTCSCPNDPAGLIGWHGTVNSFHFASDAYALDFMILNQTKLINLSPAMANYLESIGVNPTGSGKQRAYKHHT